MLESRCRRITHSALAGAPFARLAKPPSKTACFGTRPMPAVPSGNESPTSALSSGLPVGTLQTGASRRHGNLHRQFTGSGVRFRTAAERDHARRPRNPHRPAARRPSGGSRPIPDQRVGRGGWCYRLADRGESGGERTQNQDPRPRRPPRMCAPTLIRSPTPHLHRRRPPPPG